MNDFSITALHIVSAINALLALAILIGKKGAVNTIYAIFVLFSACWAAGIAFFIAFPRIEGALHIANLYYLSGGLIAAFFFLFAVVFTEGDLYFSKKTIIGFAPVIILPVLLLIFPQLIITDVVAVPAGKNVVFNTPVYTLFIGYFIAYVGAAYILFFRHLLGITTAIQQQQLRLLIWGTLPGFLPGLFYNLLLPYAGNYELIWVGPLFSLFMVVSIGYAVTKHRLFNIKVITTELLTFLIWFFVLIRIFIAENLFEQVANGILLFFLLIFGIFLIKNVAKEIEQREKLALLTEDLATANEKLKGLDKLKTEFLSLASHQLRSPLTAIKGYSSMLLENSFGILNTNQRQPIERIFESSKHLTKVVEDLLSVSKIEQGGMKYEMEVFDIVHTVKELVDDLSITAEKKGLVLNMTEPEDTRNTMVYGDLEKMRQVFLNLIDNAIKYTEKGSIQVRVEIEGDYVTTTITDSGIGLSEETKAKLFEKFTRGAEGSKVNTSGSGLGLYLAKEIVEAHHGVITITSPGIGKGTTFAVQLKSYKTTGPSAVSTSV